MTKSKLSFTRRQILKAGIIGGAGMMLPLRFLSPKAFAVGALAGLSDPALQPKFVNLVPDALSPGFIYKPDNNGNYNIKAGKAQQWTGLIDPVSGRKQKTWIWGYGDKKDNIITWPGRTFQIQSGVGETTVTWHNELRPIREHLLPIDTSLHWCYGLHGYKDYSIPENGVPIITHLHGGHTTYQFDGNPEFFYSPGGKKHRIVGPQWDNVDGGFTNSFLYDNNVPAGNLWYHDHALGITRMNVYAGMAGFYFIRDGFDTGFADNELGLPAWPYEKAYAIQDRMFRDTGELFYSAYPGDPFYEDFIPDDLVLPDDLFPDGGPTALAEFFGDHMVVNGLIWPKEDVEPRNYRMRLLNGCDSRFMVVRFRKVPADATDLPSTDASPPLPFYVIGSDQGLASEATMTNTLVFEPGSRYDIVFDFSNVEYGSRVIMENIGGDAPFGGDFGDALGSDDYFPDRQTDRIMAFDVTVPKNTNVDDNFDDGVLLAGSVAAYGGAIELTSPPTVRQVALFEGKDEFLRLQPLLGANTGTPEAPIWEALPWHSPTTENPDLDSTEIWEIYNFTGDAHPVHLHLVNFEILGRNSITFDSDDGEPGQQVIQHNGEIGVAPAITNVVEGATVTLEPSDGYVENAPKDMVTALPDQVTRIKATFDKPGRYVWHCHILSHEDHEMMRVLHVGPGA